MTKETGPAADRAPKQQQQQRASEQPRLEGVPEALNAADNLPVQLQAERLGDSRIQAAQRQAMARQVGMAGGNQALSSAVARMGMDAGQKENRPSTSPDNAMLSSGFDQPAGKLSSTPILNNNFMGVAAIQRQEGPATTEESASAPVSDEAMRQLFLSAYDAYMAEEYAQAVQQFQQLLSLPNLPAEARADIEHNLRQAMQRLFESAVDNYVNGDATTALDQFQQLLETPGLPEEARADMEHNLRRAGRQLFEQASEAYVAGRSEEAFRGFRRLVDMPGITEESRADLLHNLRQAGRHVFEDARRAYEAGDYAAARDRFRLLLEIPDLPDDARRDIEYNLGVSELRMGNYTEAIRLLERYRETASDPQELAEVEARIAEARAALGGAGAETASPVEGEAGGAEAAPGPAAGETEAGAGGMPEIDQARIFEEALRAYYSGDYSDAYQGFGRLMEAEGVPAFRQMDVLLYRGLCEVRLGIYTMALNHLENYRNRGGPQRELAEAGIAEALRGMERQRAGE